MKYVSISEFKKLNKDFYNRELRETPSIFYGKTSIEKKYSAIRKIGKTITEYADLLRAFNKEERARNKGKYLAKILREGKIVIHKKQKGFNINIGIKNVFHRFEKTIKLLEDGQILQEKQMISFFTRIYDFSDYKMGIFLN